MGTVAGFNFEVATVGADHVTVQRVHLVAGGHAHFGVVGVSISQASNVIVRDNHCEEDCIGMGSVRHVRIAGNTVRAGFIGIGVGEASDVVVEHNEVSNQPHRSDILFANVTGSRIVSNRIVDVDQSAIWLQRSDGNDIEHNSVSGNGLYGITLQDSDHNTVDSNHLVGPVAGLLIGEEDDHPIGGVSEGNLVRDNTLAGGGGVWVRDTSTSTQLIGNTSERNNGDGFLIESPTTTLRKNLADKNAGHGINAVSGVTDAGGNVAFENALSPQCINVQCASRK
jgi:parallel beta-helix repeat protein